MKIAILGSGVEGKAVENYFHSHPYTFKKDGAFASVAVSDLELTVFDNFTAETLPDLSTFDVIFRSPSVNPEIIYHNTQTLPVVTSITEYFFDHVDRNHIIGVTGTKGKGTTCSMTAKLLRELGYEVLLVGNIGAPAIESLDRLTELKEEENDHYFVVYEMSSFQLWNLKVSPHTSVVLRISPDHLDVHKDFDDYVSAKANIARYQTAGDTCIYYGANPDSQRIAQTSSGTLIPYPLSFGIDSAFTRAKLDRILDNLQVPGAHNREDAEAALLAVASALGLSLDELIDNNYEILAHAFHDYESLPHRIQFIRDLNGVLYYDDNYSSALPAAEVAIQAFASNPVVLIAGGKDRNLDLAGHKKAFFASPNIVKTILIGETKEKLAEGIDPAKYEFANNLKDAVEKARAVAEMIYANNPPVVLMSPGSASFDMFKNFNDRGEQFQKIVGEMK